VFTTLVDVGVGFQAAEGGNVFDILRTKKAFFYGFFPADDFVMHNAKCYYK